MDALGKDIQAKFTPVLELADKAIESVSRKIIARQQEVQAAIDKENARLAAIAAKAEQDRKDELDRQAQAQRDKEAAARAQADRLAAAAENEKNAKKRAEMEAEAARQQAAADKAAAAALDREQKKEAVYVPAQQVMAPKVETGQTMRDNWDAEVIDLAALVKAVSSGQAPLLALKADMVYICKRSSSDKGQLDWPGVRFFNDKTLATKPKDVAKRNCRR